MIKLDNVSKTYISKSKQKVNALNGVSFELGNTGMVFILGKSGSGKSTLLNLLGGLDAPTDGEITVDGTSMKNFLPTDYDCYRNGYVGFIFQEYNLLSNLNVKDNVAIALQLSDGENIDNNVVAALKQVELSEEYLTRRVGELSGGEKQRIAIARSIVKDSKIILADEPTGNLDSATGESIWHILKNLSQTKLVVVVSHDRESAEKYADRIIEIADGAIKSDNGAECSSQAIDIPFVAQKKHLSFATCFKMALSNLNKRKFRAISTVLISILSTFALALVQMMLSFSPINTKIHFVQTHNVPYITVSQYKADENGNDVSSYFTKDSLDYLSQNCNFIVDGLVESKQQVLDFGLTFVGEALELDENSCYICLDALRSMCGTAKDPLENYVVIDGQEYNFYDFIDSLELLVGHQIRLGNILGIMTNVWPESDEYMVLAGIIDTDNISHFVTSDNMYYDYAPQFFTTSDFKHLNVHSALINQSINDITMSLDDNSVCERVTIGMFDEHSSFNTNGLIIADGLVDATQFANFEIASDEIVLTYELYEKLFDDAKSKYYYVDRQFTELKQMPEHIGEEFELKFNDNEGKVLLNLGKRKLVGICYDIEDYILNSNYAAYIDRSSLMQVNSALNSDSDIFIQVDSIKNFDTFVKTLYEDFNVQLVNIGNVQLRGQPYSCNRVINMFSNDLNSLITVFLVIGVVLLLVLILLTINLISVSIANRRHEIGILSALGTNKPDIEKIFITETLLIAVVSFVLTLILLFALIVPINRLINIELLDYIPFLIIDVLTVAVVTIATLGFPLLAAWLPINKLSKLKPIDAIRSL